MDKTTSSAEEDNWEYDKIQKTNNNKKKNDYIYVTLLVNNASIKTLRYTHRYKDKQTQDNKMDLKTVETIEKEDPSEKTLKLTTR